MTHQNLTKLYPEIAAGGFSRVDGTVEFYQRINALAEDGMVVLDVGAGRGVQLLDTDCQYRASLSKLQGRVSRLVGVDVDPAVLGNPFLDEAQVITAGSSLPFPDATFNLIYADWVLEHVADPVTFAREVHRVLKPGGWFCARTPNRWGITGIATNVIPNPLHTRLLKVLQPDREEQDVFPTTYRLNTMRALRLHFPAADWDNFSFFSNSEPPYVQRSLLLMRLVRLLWRMSPESLHTNLLVFLRRRS